MKAINYNYRMIIEHIFKYPAPSLIRHGFGVDITFHTQTVLAQTRLNSLLLTKSIMSVFSTPNSQLSQIQPLSTSFLTLHSPGWCHSDLDQDSRICLVKYQCQSRFKISKIKILISIKIQENFGGNNVIKQDSRTR